jgi:hypothetical protein
LARKLHSSSHKEARVLYLMTPRIQRNPSPRADSRDAVPPEPEWIDEEETLGGRQLAVAGAHFMLVMALAWILALRCL